MNQHCEHELISPKFKEIKFSHTLNQENSTDAIPSHQNSNISLYKVTNFIIL
jgi:hypothetical protein